MQLMMHLHSNAYLNQLFPTQIEDNKKMAKDYDFPSRHQREVTTIESPAEKRRWRAKIAKETAEYIRTKAITQVPSGMTKLPPESEEDDCN